jgi:hypothetical protein
VSRPATLRGSQRRLLDWLQRSPADLAAAVATLAEPPLGRPRFAWLDAGKATSPARRGTREPFEIEWRGVDFLAPTCPDVVAAYRSGFWPQTGNVPNWDAVGHRYVDYRDEWLLVEAKGHLRELDQTCAAKSRSVGGSREAIGERLDEVRAAVSPGNTNDWLAHYYQYANRVATLWLLLEHGIEARLLHVCFLGDDFPDAPATADEWHQGRGRTPGLDAMHAWVGRPFTPEIEDRIHEVFLSVDQRD